MAIIEARGIKKDYYQGTIRVPALRGVDLNIEHGEFAALAGPSGSGKTTLLNMIGCLDRPTAGKIILDGVDTSKLSGRDQANLRLHKIGFVFQAYNLIPVLTAYENAEFILLLQGVPGEQRRKTVSDLLELVGLSGMERRKPTELSGGQQQRVAVARVIAAKPAVVLADEPTANLDSETGKALLQVMEELNERERVTFLFSTHDPMVMKRAHRLIQLKDGLVSSDERREPFVRSGADEADADETEEDEG